MDRRDFFTRLATLAAAGNIARGARPAIAAGANAIPDVPVVTQDGKHVHFYRDLVKGKIVLINFFYANCTGICPRMTSNLVKVHKLLGDRVGRDIFFYSVSLKPEEDTPERLRHYHQMHGLGQGWDLLRAKRNDMELLRASLGFKDSDPVLDANINEHTGVVRYGNDATGTWMAGPALGNPETLVESVLWLDPKIPRRGYGA